MKLPYEPGDIVRTYRTVEVDEVTDCEIFGTDVQSGQPYYYVISDGSSARVEMVRKGVRKSSRKPAVGASLTGRDIGRIWWKRGTIIHHKPAGEGGELVLHADGLWHSVTYDQAFEFEDLNPEAKFEIKYVA